MTQDIRITPSSGEPQILFRGSGTNDTAIELNVLSSYESATGSGTALVFDGTQGRLLSVTDNLSSGTIYSVSNISGLPLIDADASGFISINKYGSGVTIYSDRGLTLTQGAPSSTTNRLYNVGGTLYFNGSGIGGGGGGGGDTYTAGTGLELSGTEFNIDSTVLQSGDNIGSLVNDAGYLNAHPSISAASSSDNSGRTYIQDVLLDANGHITGIATATETVTDTDTTYTAGTGLILVGTEFNINNTVAQSGDNVGIFVNDAGYLTSHPSISAASSSDNSGRTYIQDILLDSNGHITGISTAAETVVDTDTTYTAGTGLTLVGAEFNIDDAVIQSGNNISLLVNDSGYINAELNDLTGSVTWANVPDANITQSSVVQHSGAIRITESQIVDLQSYLTAHPGISAASDSDNSGRTYIQDILLDSNGHVTGIATATETVTDTDTTYTAGTGLTLNDTTFDANVNPTVQTTAAESVTSTANRTYAIQVNASDDLVVNVPWTAGEGGGGGDITSVVAGSGLSGGGTTGDVTLNVSGVNTDLLQGTVANNQLTNSSVTITAGTGLSNGGSVALGGSVSIDIDSSVMQTGDNVSLLTNDAGYLTAYSETGTLQTVTDNGSTTSNAITINDNLTAEKVFADLDGPIVLACKNTTGSQINAGTPVYVSGYFSGNGKALISPAVGNNSSKMPAIGLLESNLSDDTEGNVHIFGLATSFDTSSFSVGETIYVAATGGLTNTRPTGVSDLVQNMGRVLRSDASQGRVLLLGPGRSNDVPNSGNFTELTVDNVSVLTAHPSISAASSVDNSARTYIQDLTLDSNGHVTAIVSAAETVTDTNTTYTAGTGLSLSGTEFNVSGVDTSLLQGTIGSAQIANDAIDSQHYTDGSIDTAHIGDDQVTVDKLANSINTAIDANTAKNTNVSTNLSATANGTSLTVESSDGSDVSLPAATTSAWGVMSDDQATKLDGIEASADVTDVTNVTAAGALMDSEVTNLSQVKAFDSSDYATAAQGTKADSAQQPPSEGAFVDGDKTKLDAIEASADVTDATNVTAAGALMDSELASIADVKALDQSVISGSSPNFTTANMSDASNKRFMTDAQESKLDGIEASATADQTKADIDGLAITRVGTIDSGVWNGTAIATTYIADNAITGTKIALGSDAAGDVMYYNGTDYVRLGIGTDGQVLTVNDSGNAPQWEDASGGGGGISNVVEDTTPQLGGDLDLNGNQILNAQCEASAATDVALTAKGAASQSASFFEATDSSDTVVAKVYPSTLASNFLLQKGTGDNVKITARTHGTATNSWAGVEIDSDGQAYMELDRGGTTDWADVVFRSASSTKIRLGLEASQSRFAIQDFAAGNYILYAPNNGTDVTTDRAWHFNKAAKGALKTESDGATITFDLDEANTHTVTLGGNRTLALSNADVGQKFIIRLTQDGTGSRTVTWFSTIKWPGGVTPTLTTTANKTDVFGFICTSTNNYDGFVVGYNL